MSQEFIEALKKRRTYYHLGKHVEQKDADLVHLIREAIKHTPSPFHNQSTRAVVLFNEDHDKLWEIVWNHVKDANPKATAEDVQNTRDKVDRFKAAYGTVLFFEDQASVRKLEEEYPLYAENFKLWSEQVNGGSTMNVWTALCNAGLGANLQHYNPLIDDDVRQAWNIPEDWVLRSEMPFGSIEAETYEKDFIPMEERVLVFGEK